LSRLRDIAGSLSSEARAMTKKLPGVQVVVLVFDANDTSLAWVHDGLGTHGGWDQVAARLKGTGEEVRQQLRSQL
jgi:hypothetical protein